MQNMEVPIRENDIALEQVIVGAQPMPGNKVVLLKDGPATYQEMFAALCKPHDHIN